MFVNGFSIEELGGRYCGGTCTYRVRGRGGGGGGAYKRREGWVKDGGSCAGWVGERDGRKATAVGHWCM